MGKCVETVGLPGFISTALPKDTLNEFAGILKTMAKADWQMELFWNLVRPVLSSIEGYRWLAGRVFQIHGIIVTRNIYQELTSENQA